jgi:hypothetical protein
MKQLEYEDMLNKIEVLEGSIKEAEVKLAEAKRGREDDEEEEDEEGVTEGGGDDGEGKPKATTTTKTSKRAKKMARRAELTSSLAAKTVELEKLQENDPQAIADLEKELRLVTEAATRWTDNIFACQEYMVKKRGMVKKEVNKMIGISDAFDCESYIIYFYSNTLTLLYSSLSSFVSNNDDVCTSIHFLFYRPRREVEARRRLSLSFF